MPSTPFRSSGSGRSRRLLGGPSRVGGAWPGQRWCWRSSRDGWQRAAFLIVAIVALYRAVLFIHEITHRAGRDLPGVHARVERARRRAAAHSLVPVRGRPHRSSSPELLRHRGGSGVHAVRPAAAGADPRSALATSLLAPVALAVRFGILAPLSWAIPAAAPTGGRHAARRWPSIIATCAARRSRPPAACRKPPPARWSGRRSVCGGRPTPDAAFVCWVIASAVVSGVNAVRTLAAHRYDQDSGELSMTEQLLDSCTIATEGRLPLALADVCRALLAPVGLRYHALHHWIPSLPYHNLGRAHRVLVSTLRADAPYRGDGRTGFLPPLRDLLRRSRAAARHWIDAGISQHQATRAMRIGICAPYDLGRDGGVNSHIRAQARALRALGHDVCVFGASSAPLADGERALSGCVSLVIGGTETGIGVDPRSWWRVAELLRTARFDVLHMHEPLMPLVPWFALRQSTRAGGRHVPHASREGASMVWPVPLAARAVDAANPHAPGRLGRRATHCRQTSSLATTRSCRTGSTSIDSVGPTARPAEMPAHLRFVLFVGRLEPRKGVDRLIRAMPIVQQHAPDARLAIVGDGPDRAALEAAARDAGVDVLFTGRVSDDALAGLLSRRRHRLLAGARRRELRDRAARSDGRGAADRGHADRGIRGDARRRGKRPARGRRRLRRAGPRDHGAAGRSRSEALVGSARGVIRARLRLAHIARRLESIYDAR